MIQNYCIDNVPFYLNNIFDCKYKHVKLPLYFYRIHGQNFLLTGNKNREIVFGGKVKFIDYIIRRYIIQKNILGNFNKNKVYFYNLITNYYLNLLEFYKDETIEIKKCF
ncbi:hypothetical protein [Caloramator sp. Dgby_cultured_2]|uniref:hypothetical protein n=1 Tax=Caloramator sp. Dgby_cultured_2 TaxID=3029174 RepID=UPI00237E1105|nr:hypothetical protein [Caloramator sp. Dgby_cultured_2]WDU83959.1 hypothetical protein PWK10_05710 [Caloramator sp. Dgby_cultured_2]